MRARHTWTSPTGEQREVRDAEFWLDDATGRARYDQRSITGSYHKIARRNGRTFSIEDVRTDSVSSQTFADDTEPLLSGVRGRVLHYRDAMASGGLRGAGVEEVAGQPTVVVFEPARFEGVDRLRVSVSKASGMPLQVVSYRGDVITGFQEVERESISYSVVERIDPALLPGDVFTPPTVGKLSSHEYLTVQTAEQFRRFPVFWVGPQWGGMPVTSLFHSALDQDGVHSSSFHLVYAHPGGAGGGTSEFQLVQRPASSPSASEGCGQPGMAPVPSQSVTVRGVQAVLCETGAEGVSLQLTLDGTAVRIHASDRQAAVQAAEALRRLN